MNKFLSITMLAAGLLHKIVVPAAEQPKAADLKKIPTAQLIQEIKDEYKIKGPQDCVTGVSKQDISKAESFDTPYQEACVVAGYKPVLFDSSEKEAIDNPVHMNPKVREFNSRPDSPAGYFFAPDKTGEMTLYMYAKTHRNELNAYRFALAELQGTTDYLTGMFLGYPPESIKFFYIAHNFLKRFPPTPTTANFDAWPQELKNKFQDYKNTSKDLLNKYKNDALKWLAAKNIKLEDFIKDKIAVAAVAEKHGEVEELTKGKALVAEIFQSNNPYLIGWALGTEENHIEFLILAEPFLQDVAKIKSYGVGNYPEWPAEMKQAFEQYEKSPEGLKQYQDDAVKAQQWLAQNRRKTIPQLKAEIKQLEAAIPKHEKKPVTEEKTIEQKLKEQGIQVLDYNQARDFNDIVKAYEQFDDMQLKFLHVDKRSEMLKTINSYFKVPYIVLPGHDDEPGAYSISKVLRSTSNELVGVLTCNY